jgi:hypothetical protein
MLNNILKNVVKKVFQMVKDIVQPKKRRVKMGINRFISTLYTIADAF